MPPGQVQLVGLTKRFGDVLAVDDLSLEIRAGEVSRFSVRQDAGRPRPSGS